MKYFSMPADFKRETIDKFRELNDKYGDSRVVETYGQLTVGNVLNSGRVTEWVPQVDLNQLETFVAYSQDNGIVFNYTLNPSCMGNEEFSSQGIRKIKNLLKNLHHIGIRSLTVTVPSLFELVQSTGMDFRIKASAICEITSLYRARFYKELGAERIVVDPDITRDFALLKEICSYFGKGVELIINNVCYKSCPYKMFHYNHEAHLTPGNNVQQIKDYYLNRCAMQKAKNIENIIKLNWVRPEDLKYYSRAGITHFKIQGRQNVLKGDAVKALEHYMKEDFDGNLYDLITIFAPYTAFQPYIDNKELEGFVKKFFDDPGFCKDNCQRCNYCSAFAGKSIRLEEAERINRHALAYFNESDAYTRHLKKENQSKHNPAENLLSGDGSRFDFE